MGFEAIGQTAQKCIPSFPYILHGSVPLEDFFSPCFVFLIIRSKSEPSGASALLKTDVCQARRFVPRAGRQPSPLCCAVPTDKTDTTQTSGSSIFSPLTPPSSREAPCVPAPGDFLTTPRHFGSICKLIQICS